MNTYRTTLSWLIAGSLLLIGMAGIPSVSVGEDPDPPFVETAYGGLEDMRTGLVWGKDINESTGMNAPQWYIDRFYYLEDPDADPEEPLHPEYSGGFTDWRRPTVGEILTAVANGIVSYLDANGEVTYMDFSYDPGIQDANYDKSDGQRYGETYYWTACKDKMKGPYVQPYKVRFGNGDDISTEWLHYSGSGWMLAVRGGPENHDNCPGKHGGVDDHGKPDKPGKPPK